MTRAGLPTAAAKTEIPDNKLIMPLRYEVKEGECVASVADALGFFGDTIWNYPDNAALKSARKDPNVLMPGDILVIPDKRPKEASCSTDARHTFKRKGTPCRLDLALRDEKGHPRTLLEYSLVIDGRLKRGTTDGDGRILEWIPPGSKHGVLRIGDSETYALQFHYIDPVDSESGVRERLVNLGFLPRASAEDADALKTAIAQFQAAAGLPATGERDAETQAKLKQMHRS